MKTKFASGLFPVLTAVLIAAITTSYMPAFVYGDSIAEAGSTDAVSREYVLYSDSDISNLSMPEHVKSYECADSHAGLMVLDSASNLPAVKKNLESRVSDIIIQPNYKYRSEGTSDPFFSKQWGLSNSQNNIDIGFNKAREIINSRTGSLSRTVVAVIDTGYDYHHFDLIDSVWKNEDEIAGNGVDDDGNGYTDDSYGYDFTKNAPITTDTSGREYEHGTHCAGTIGASVDNGIGISGIASVSGTTTMMNLKVLSGLNGSGNTYDLIRAIKYAEANGADICNISMGTYSRDSILYDIMKNSDMLFVCAAGNDGFDMNYTPMYPCCFDLNNIIGVSNIKRSGRLLGLSNYGSETVDIAAPGTDIYSTMPGNTYDYMDGTSMSAPFVSGTAALLHSYYHGITAPQIKQLIVSTATKTGNLSGKVIYGGYLNAAAALSAKSPDYYATAEAVKSPKINIIPISGSYREMLTVSCGDDGYVPKVTYARGSHSFSYFQNGNGKALALDSSGSGKVKLSIPGTYTVMWENASGTSRLKKVICTADAVKSIKLNYTKKSLKKGHYFHIRATLSKSGKYGRVLSYSSSKKSVATVSSKGKVVARKKGYTYITVKTSNGLSARCKVTVR